MLTIVTSFNKAIWESHGKTCITSWLDHLVGDYTLKFYIDGPIPNDLPVGKGIEVFFLDNDKDYVKFLRDTANIQEPQGVPPEHQFRFQFRRFWPKVHAIYSAFQEVSDYGVDGALLWLDADILMTQDLEVSKILADADNYKEFCILDRGPPWGYMDSGYLLMNTKLSYDGQTWASQFINLLNNLYTSKTIFQFREWHDAYLMSQVLKMMFGEQGSEAYKANVKSLSGLSSSLHPLEESWLRGHLTHLKGGRKNEIRNTVLASEVNDEENV